MVRNLLRGAKKIRPLVKKMTEQEKTDRQGLPESKKNFPTEEEIEKIKKYIAKEVAVETVHADYQFSERLFSGEKVRCAGWTLHSRDYRVLREVENYSILLDDENIPFVSGEVRFPGSIFLGGVNGETYAVELITKIEFADEIIFQKSPEDYMPDDIRKKLKTHKSVPLPPPMDDH